MAAVSSLVEELYGLSPNQELFRTLQDGRNLVHLVLDEHTEELSTLWAKTHNHLVTFFQQNDDGRELEEFIASLNSDDDKMKVYGECILALTATKNAHRRSQLRKALRMLLQVNPSDETLIRARREWQCILFHEIANELSAQQKLNIRYVIASWTNICRPGLVGQSFYQLGCEALENGDLVKARECYETVENCLFNNLKNCVTLPENLRFEVYGMIYWYRQACGALMAMDPTVSHNIQLKLQQVEQHLPTVQFEPPTHQGMIGPIAKTYLSRHDYLKKLLKEIVATDCSNKGLEQVCYRYDYCHEIDDLLFAIERHRMVLPLIPAGVQMFYEAPIQEALDALRSLDDEQIS